MQCPITFVKFNKKFFIAGILGVIFTSVFDFVLHQNILKDLYAATAHLWRPESEMVCWAMMLGTALFVFGSVGIFSKNFEGKGISEGIRFGILLAVITLPGSLTMYSVMPIPMNLLMFWLGGTVIQCVGLGVLYSLVYKK